MSVQPLALALAGAAAIAATLGIAGYYTSPRRPRLSYLGRPLAGVLILAIALTGDPGADPRYFWGVAAGLLLAIVADVLLMLPRDLFLYGLLGFAGTHVCFLIAFTSEAPFAGRPLPFALLGLVGAGVVAFIWPGVEPALRLPVIVYVALLVAMASQAWSRYLEPGGVVTLWAAVGATIFVASDATLSIEVFRHRFGAARFIVLATFYVADTLIAVSAATLA